MSDNAIVRTASRAAASAKMGNHERLLRDMLQMLRRRAMHHGWLNGDGGFTKVGLFAGNEFLLGAYTVGQLAGGGYAGIMEVIELGKTMESGAVGALIATVAYLDLAKTKEEAP